ncbi:hypothetical protein [Microcoleus sp.]|uniref:hypothetical protein n=1 Tax=Microcoleus sp. TaxID=44472 RepID=UPI003594619A
MVACLRLLQLPQGSCVECIRHPADGRIIVGWGIDRSLPEPKRGWRETRVLHSNTRVAAGKSAKKPAF